MVVLLFGPARHIEMDFFFFYGNADVNQGKHLVKCTASERALESQSHT